MRMNRVVMDIRNMKIRGAKAIAIAGLKALRSMAQKNGFGKEFNNVAKKLVSIRPTAVALYNAVEKIKREKSLEAIDKMIYYFENIGDVIGTVNYELIRNGYTLLTHCHSGTVVDLLKTAKRKGRRFNVFVTETRPRWQGRITAEVLVKADIPVIYIVDSAAGFYIEDIDMMLFGCDAIRKEGVVNKIGTYMLAVLAKEHKIPVYFAGGLMKLDKRKKLIIEERSPSEVMRKRETKKFDIRNPSFDITPWPLIKAILTEKGSLKPRQILRKLKR